MQCPICGSKLPHLEEFLAQTHVGTQCPRCWARLRRLSPELTVIPAKKKLQPRAEPLRRAA